MSLSESRVAADRTLKYYKMHGLGNDYVYMVEGENDLPSDLSGLARAVSERHCGIGADGLVIVGRRGDGILTMRMWNADGTEAQMCGNASRCVALLGWLKGLVDTPDFSLYTKAGIKGLHLNMAADGSVESVTVDMGMPVLDARHIPVDRDAHDGIIEFDADIFDRNLRLTAVGMGNPHGIVFQDHSPTDYEVLTLGPELERHPAWPEKANIEFARVTSRSAIEMRVWERGTGETMACGTGACATAVAAMLRGMTDRRVSLRLRGGELTIEWREDNGHVMMTGPATLVASGRFHTDSISANPFIRQYDTAEA